MKLSRLELESFGAFERQTWTLADGTGVLFGQNEAGKSTLLTALETLLYGFEPAARDRHPLAPRSESGPLIVRGTFELAGGARLDVERRLDSRASLRIARNGDAFEGARKPNRPLREVEGTPRALYRSIYSLSAAQLVELEGDVRATVDELLLGESALPGLRPVHRVREELRAARQELWRPDNRGKPRARALRSDLNAARKAYHAARSSEDGLRRGLLEEAELQRELGRCTARRAALERERADAAFLADALELTRRRESKGQVDLSQLAGEPLTDPIELERELREIAETVAEHAARTERKLDLTRTHARILARAGAIEAARTARGRYEARQEALEHARDRMRQAESEALAAWTRLSGGRPQRSSLSRLRGFPLEGLRAELAAWEEAREEQPGASAATWLGWLAALVGSGVVVATSLDLLAPSFVALGLTFLFLAYLELRVRALSRKRSGAPPGVAESLARLQLPGGLAATPPSLARLIDQLEAVTARLDGLESSEDHTLALARELEVQEEEWEQLLEELQLGSHAEGVEAAAQLEDALGRAREREARVKADRQERERAQALVDAYRPRLDQLRERLAGVEATLRKAVLGEPDRSAAFRALRQRLREIQYLDGRLQELRLDPRWDRLVEGQTPAPADFTGDEARAARAHELEQLERRAAEIHRRLGELTAERRESPANRVALAKERVVQLEQELEDVRRRHDRLALAEAILVRADHRWREANQPDVLRRASAYLTQISGGRYARVDYPAEGESGLVVHDAANEPLPVAAPLSRGTRDQIYLALRLGLLDHLDEGRAPLPLILDEALVHWDAARRARLYPLLARVGRRRQVLLATCHEPFASEAARALGTAPIVLTGARVATGGNR